MKIITTTYEAKQVKTTTGYCDFRDEDISVEGEVINLYPDVTFQEIIGFGGAFTESFGYTMSQLSHDVQEEIMEAYFGENGLGYTMCRLHLDSCDFSLSNYSAVTDPDDTELKTFSLERDQKYILPYIKRAQELSAQKIHYMMSPWSPPAFMKSNGMKNCGGRLLPQYYDLWGRYMAKYVAEYRKMGIDIIQLTVQNEANATQTWDSCVYTAEEERDFVKDCLGPAMEAAGAGDTDILVWDHNKERVYERAKAVFSDAKADCYAKGIAFHWYSGDHFEAVRLVAKCYPDKKLVLSEGAFEYIAEEGIDQLNHAQIYAHQMIGNFNAGMHATIDWNLALNEQGGPNHVGNWAVAPVMCDTQNNSYEKQLSYTYIGHFSRYIKPGAKRIGYSSYLDKLEVTAFQNTDGQLAAVILNRTEEELPFHIRVEGKLYEDLKAPGCSIITLLL